MKNIFLSIGLVFVTALVSAQNVFEASGERSVQKIALEPYTTIAIDEMLNIELLPEKNDHIYIDADDAIHPIIKAEVDGGVLKVYLDTPKGVNIIQTGGITVKIPVKGTEELSVKGGKVSAERPIKLSAYKINFDMVSEINLDLNIEALDLKIGSCRRGKLQLNSKKLTLDVGSVNGLAIAGKADEVTFESSRIVTLEAFDLKIQDAVFNTSGIAKVKLHIDGSITGKPSGIFELQYKGKGVNRIEGGTRVKVVSIDN